jgi:hypothetical protein
VTGYPHELAGEPAPAPEQVPVRVLAMALKAHRKHLEAVDHSLVTAAPHRNAAALDVLLTECNTAAPSRHKASDGAIGDLRHQGAGAGSDHNPWLIYAGKGIVRARDLTNDPVLDLPRAFERLRSLAQTGRLPQVTGGGYAILNGRITAPDWSGWRAYSGADPHVAHGHVSVSREPALFDSRAPWGLFLPEQAPAPQPQPAPPPAPAGPGWTGPDLTGTAEGLRGDVGNNGPRVAAWQEWLNRYAPAYSRLAVDGWWGPATTAVNAEFGHRSGIGSADGRNIGPRLAAAYWRAGLFRTVAAAPPPKPSARDRVRSHLDRGARR